MPRGPKYGPFLQGTWWADGSASVDNSESFGFSHGLVAARYIEFVVNVLAVTFNGRRSDKELVRNLLVAQLFRQQLQDLELSLR